MKKEILEQAKYLKDNFHIFFVLTLLLSPCIWKLIDMYYQGRLESYKSEIEVLRLKADDADKKKQDLKDAILNSDQKSTDWSKIKSD